MGAKIVHKADRVSISGRVSALCFKKPRAINLKLASWTNRDDAVTCKACKTVMADRADEMPPLARTEPGIGLRLLAAQGKVPVPVTEGEQHERYEDTLPDGEHLSIEDYCDLED